MPQMKIESLGPALFLLTYCDYYFLFFQIVIFKEIYRLHCEYMNQSLFN